MLIVPLVAAALGGLAGWVEPPAVDQARLMCTLRELPVRRAALGGPGDVEGLRATETFLTDRLKQLGYEPELEPIEWSPPTHSPPAPWHNIIVELKGSALPDEVLIVGAHFDTVLNSPGADDNGTGTAALLELARVLKERQFRRTVRLVFFNLEEVGLVGSKRHASNLQPRLRPAKPAPDSPPGSLRVIGMISLEMIGYFTDAPDSQTSPIAPIPGVYTPPTVGDFLAVVTVRGYQKFSRRLADEMIKGSPGLKVLSADFLPVPTPDMLRSDHAPFLALGIPAVMLTDTANFRNPNYHAPGDTAETIDAARFTEVVRGLAAAVAALARPVDSTPEDAGAARPPAGGLDRP